MVCIRNEGADHKEGMVYPLQDSVLRQCVLDLVLF